MIFRLHIQNHEVSSWNKLGTLSPIILTLIVADKHTQWWNENSISDNLLGVNWAERGDCSAVCKMCECLPEKEGKYWSSNFWLGTGVHLALMESNFFDSVESCSRYANVYLSLFLLVKQISQSWKRDKNW